MEKNKLLVIVVTYNAMTWAEKCLGSLYSSSIRPDVFVVDNGSTDGTQAYITENYPHVIFKQSRVNLGFGKANNLGMQYAMDNGFDYVYLLNQDAWVMEDTFESLIEVSKKNPQYGILGPFQMNADLKHIDVNFIRNVCAWQSNPDIFNDFYNHTLDDVYSVTSLMAAHWFMTSECIMKVGGFSPSFPHYGEDDNYIERSLYHGYKVGVLPSLKVVHDRSERKMTTSMYIYRNYICLIESLSNPISTSSTVLKYVIENMSMVFRYLSLKPLLNLGKILIHMRRIKKNKRISILQDKAFLN